MLVNNNDRADKTYIIQMLVLPVTCLFYDSSQDEKCIETRQILQIRH